ncbi:hypothetical protein MIR68_005930 [Amoeboaphelidium protococcarum]|nr:hypothetical protein MIR68_005930 [Amoeboaphelidium protococcarum]
MSIFYDLSACIKELLPLFTIGGTVVSAAAGLVPRPVPESIRKAEIQYLRSRLVKKDFEERYLVVTGEKGVGKSCLLRTATSKMPGNQRVSTQLDFFRPMGSAKRVIFWHRLFTFGSPPIVVINATEREPGDRYAGLTGAVPTLADEFKL